MSIKAFVSELLSRRQQEEQIAARTYGELCLSLADGKQEDSGTAQSILDACGRTPADLQRDVERLLDLRAAKEVASRKPELVAAIAALRYEREEAKQESARIEVAHYENIQRINLEVAALDGKIAKCCKAEDALLSATEASESELELQEQTASLSRALSSSGDGREAIATKLRETHRKIETERQQRLRNLIAAGSEG